MFILLNMCSTNIQSESGKGGGDKLNVPLFALCEYKVMPLGPAIHYKDILEALGHLDH